MPTVVAKRVPMTVRLPRETVAVIEDYAHEHRVTKTDALEHFLNIGIEYDSGLYRAAKAQARPQASKRVLEDDRIRHVVCEEAARFPAIRSVTLFGSYARGDADSNSDVDLRLVLDGGGFSLFDLARFSEAVESRLGCEVDLVTAEKLRNSNLAAAIQQEGRCIYERQGD